MDHYNTTSYCELIGAVPQVYDMRCRPFMVEAAQYFHQHGAGAMFSSPVEYVSLKKKGSFICQSLSAPSSLTSLYSTNCLEFPFRSTSSS